MKRTGMWIAVAGILLTIATLIAWFIHTRGTQYLWFLALAIGVSGFFAVLPLVVFRSNREKPAPDAGDEAPRVVRWDQTTTTTGRSDTRHPSTPGKSRSD